MSGEYDGCVGIESSTFGRHHEQNGDRYGEPAEVTVGTVEVETAQAASEGLRERAE